MQKVIGTLLNIRYYNEVNNYLIGVFRGEVEDFKAIGTMINPLKGAEYELSGEEVENEKWGKQFKFRAYRQVVPEDEQGIYRYLVHTVKWVGPAPATKMIEKYGDETLKKLKEDPEGVADEIRGITRKRALEIQELMYENAETEETIVALEAIIGGCGIRKNMPTELAKQNGWAIIDAIRSNPYILTKYHGIGFLTADMIALHRIKIAPDSILRKKAGVQYILEQNESKGNTWIKDADLHRQAAELLHCDPSDGIYESLKKEAYIEEDMIASAKTAASEHAIANMVVEMTISACDRFAGI